MKTPQKHAELIKAWADGAEIEMLNADGTWGKCGPTWSDHIKYRIKPDPKPDVMSYYYVNADKTLFRWTGLNPHNADLRIIVDGETGELKSAEVLK